MMIVRTIYGWGKVLSKTKTIWMGTGYHLILLGNSYFPGQEILFYSGPILETEDETCSPLKAA